MSSRVTRGGGSEQAPPSSVAPAPGGTFWGSSWILGCPWEVGGVSCLLMWRGVQSRVQGDLGQEPLSPVAWATPSHFRARPLGASAFIYSQCCHPTLGSHRETPKNKAWSGSSLALSLRATLPRPQRSCPCWMSGHRPHQPWVLRCWQRLQDWAAGYAHLQSEPPGAAQLLAIPGSLAEESQRRPQPDAPLLPRVQPQPRQPRSGCSWVITQHPHWILRARWD